jgi:hypothetical protein
MRRGSGDSRRRRSDGRGHGWTSGSADGRAGDVLQEHRPADDAVAWGHPPAEAPPTARTIRTSRTEPTEPDRRATYELVAFVLAVLAGLAVFTWLGDGALAPPPLEPSSWSAWAADREPVLVALALGRLLVLALLWYVVGATALTALATLARSARLLRVAEIISVPAVHRVVRAGLGAGLAVSVVTSSMASPSQVLSVADAIAATADATTVEDAEGAEDARPTPLLLAERALAQPDRAAETDVDADARMDADAATGPGPAAAGEEPAEADADVVTRSGTDRETPRRLHPARPAPFQPEVDGRIAVSVAPDDDPADAPRHAPSDADAASNGREGAEGSARVDSGGDAVVRGGGEGPARTGAAVAAPAGGRAGAPARGSEVAHDREVTVEVGDSFWRVAERVVAAHGDTPPTDAEVTRYWQRLIEHNRDRLTDPDEPDLLYPGQVLVLPELEVRS